MDQDFLPRRGFILFVAILTASRMLQAHQAWSDASDVWSSTALVGTPLISLGFGGAALTTGNLPAGISGLAAGGLTLATYGALFSMAVQSARNTAASNKDSTAHAQTSWIQGSGDQADTRTRVETLRAHQEEAREILARENLDRPSPELDRLLTTVHAYAATCAEPGSPGADQRQLLVILAALPLESLIRPDQLEDSDSCIPR